LYGDCRARDCDGANRPVRDGILVENASPTTQSPSRQGRNVKIVDFNVQSLRDFPPQSIRRRHFFRIKFVL
ncbi:MAG: hypothetical protein LBD59_04655, partial [Prevotellaceae bacterium]|nr:hypothetical protein [Prevotellaceae bacterium]